MKAYVIRRLLLLIPTWILVTMIVFLLVRFIPGDVIDVMISQVSGGMSLQVDREELLKMLGLDQPVYVQYGRWVGGMLFEGTLGESLLGGWTVEEKILGRLPLTMELGFFAILIALIIAVPVGIFSALRQDTAGDYLGRSFAILGLATPDFWLATMVMIFPAIWWAWSPPIGMVAFTEDPVGHLKTLVLPCLILGTGFSASIMRLTRTMMLEVLRQDYIRTAWSKGLKERVIIIRHAVKKCPHPGRDPDWSVFTAPGGGRRDHREYFCAARLGPSLSGGPIPQRLPGGLWNQPVACHHGNGRQSPGRSALSLFRSQGPLQITGNPHKNLGGDSYERSPCRSCLYRKKRIVIYRFPEKIVQGKTAWHRRRDHRLDFHLYQSDGSDSGAFSLY